MIPKKIHYCWFGKTKLPRIANKCIESWKKYCPDYEIIEWNESNFDINYCDYTKEAYKAKKYAFISDVARLYVLINYGGIYMDIDHELLKPIDSFLKYSAFIGFEESNLGMGILGSITKNEIFSEILYEYKNLYYIRTNLIPNNFKFTAVFCKYGLIKNDSIQKVKDITIFPSYYFYGKRIGFRKNIITKNTYSIHHYYSSWYDMKARLYVFVAKFINKGFADKIVQIKQKIFNK